MLVYVIGHLAVTRWKNKHRMDLRLFLFSNYEMNIRFRLISVAVCLLAVFSIHTTKAQTLVLHHADGTQTDVQLLTQPRVTFENDKLLITSSVIYMEYPKEDILRFTFKSSTTGIRSAQGKTDYTREGGLLVFHGIKSGDKVAVYTLKGIRVPVRLNHRGNDATLSLASIPSGAYLLQVNGRTSKFTKP